MTLIVISQVNILTYSQYLKIGVLFILGLGVALLFTRFSFDPNYLVHLSSILTLCSFTARNMLFLRLLAIGAQITFIPYCFLQPTPLWSPILWNLLFLAVNILNLVLLLLEKRPVVFTADEEKLYQLAFNSLTPREFLKLLTVGEFCQGQPGEMLSKKGEPTVYISVLVEGSAAVLVEGEEGMLIRSGKLCGLESALASESSFIDIVLKEPSKYFRWSVVQLRQYLNNKPEIRDKFRTLVSHDLVKSVNRLAETVVSNKVTKLDSDSSSQENSV